MLKTIVVDIKKVSQDILNLLFVNSAESTLLEKDKRIFSFESEEQFSAAIEILEAQKKPYTIEYKANTMLQEAVRNGNKNEILSALSQGADVNCLDRSDFAKLHPTVEKDIMELIADYFQQNQLAQERKAAIQSQYIKSYILNNQSK